MKECKSIEVMNKDRMQICQAPAVENPIQWPTARDSRSAQNSFPKWFRWMKEYRYVGGKILCVRKKHFG
jgi:hypothetical protein